MAEFVELALERLLPTFEQLQSVELFSQSEVSDLIKKCRRYEYQMAKQTKSPSDFLRYADYLSDVLNLIRARRDETGYHHKYDLIDKQLKLKCAFLYSICSERFKKVEHFAKEIDFLKNGKLYAQCSKSYTRLLQFHGHILQHYIDAGTFEFFHNKSVENARNIFQTAIRKFPNETAPYLGLFDVELGFIKFLIERREYFLKLKDEPKSGEDDDGDSPPEKRTKLVPDQEDDILAFKLVRIIYEQTLASFPSEKHAELLYDFWNLATKYSSVAQEIVDELHKLLENPDYDSYLNSRLVEESTEREEKTSPEEKEHAKWATKIEEVISSCAQEKKVEKIFNEAFLHCSSSRVSARLKDARIRYLHQRYPSEQKRYREEYKRLAKMLPTSEDFHLNFIKIEKSVEIPDDKLIISAFENCVREFGSTSVECWLKYSEYLIQTCPDKVGAINHRATLNLSRDQLSMFYERISEMNSNLIAHQ